MDGRHCWKIVLEVDKYWHSFIHIFSSLQLLISFPPPFSSSIPLNCFHFIPLSSLSSPLLFPYLSRFLSFPFCSSSVVLLLPFSPPCGKDLVTQTLSKTITTPPRRPLISPFSSPPSPPTSLPPSSHPSTHLSIHRLPLFLDSCYPTPGPARVSLPFPPLSCVCVHLCLHLCVSTNLCISPCLFECHI